jgi:hypothetical protein
LAAADQADNSHQATEPTVCLPPTRQSGEGVPVTTDPGFLAVPAVEVVPPQDRTVVVVEQQVKEILVAAVSGPVTTAPVVEVAVVLQQTVVPPT